MHVKVDNMLAYLEGSYALLVLMSLKEVGTLTATNVFGNMIRPMTKVSFEAF